MIEKEFGKLVENLLQISGQKNNSLAIELGYDVSYISKWINSSTLPTVKNINEINSRIAKFIVDFSSEESLNNLVYNFDIQLDGSDDEELVLVKRIKDELYKSYLYSYNKYNKKSLKKKSEINNSIQKVNPSLSKKYIDAEIIDIFKNYSTSKIILMCDLFSLTKSDKIKLSVVEKLQDSKKEHSKDMKCILSFNEDVLNIILDTMLFINMVTSSNRINTEFYVCNFTTNSFIMAVKDICTHTAVFHNKKCITSVISSDELVANEMYETLEDISKTQSKLIFTKKTSEEIIAGEYYINYIMDGELKILMGEISELFMPSDLFLELGEMLFKNDELIICRLKKIDTILQNITYNSNIDIVLYENIFREYLYNGKVTFFNKPIVLTVEQRKRHIAHMKNIFEKNINIKLVQNLPLDDYQSDEKISMYTSQSIRLLKEKNNDVIGDYLIVKDYRLNNIFNLFFEQVWNQYGNIEDKQVVLKLISDFEKYGDVIKEIYF